MAVGYKSRLLRCSRVQDQATMFKQSAEAGRYVAEECRRRLLRGSRVQEEAAMWQQGIGGG